MPAVPGFVGAVVGPDKKVVGTCFVAAPGGYLLTARHVLRAHPGSSALLYDAQGRRHLLPFEEVADSEAHDISLLQLKSEFRAFLVPSAVLCRPPGEAGPCKAWGHPDRVEPAVELEVAYVTERSDQSTLQLRSDQLKPGTSGGPVAWRGQVFAVQTDEHRRERLEIALAGRLDTLPERFWRLLPPLVSATFSPVLKMAAPTPNASWDHRFSVGPRLGGGQWGEVFHAIDNHSGHRPVALKRAHAVRAAKEEDRRRFFRGARRLLDFARERHIVHVLALSPDDVEPPAYAMELYPRTLTHLLTPDSVESAFKAVRDAAEGLRIIHARGWVHRDIKPQNILVDAEGTGMLSDFDLLHVPAESDASGALTGGLPPYTAPELLSGEVRNDPRSDLYSLAWCCIAALLGRPLRASDTLECITKYGVEPMLCAVLQKAIHPDRERRFESITQFLGYLDSYRKAPNLPRAGPPTSRRHPNRAGPRPTAETPAMLVLEADSFLMGSHPDPFGPADEHPRHTVHLTRRLLVGLAPVTVGQWRSLRPDFVTTEPDSAPVTRVSWDAVIDWCNDRSSQEGFDPVYRYNDEGDVVVHLEKGGYRLPTEAEWEYFCRAGTLGDWWHGGDVGRPEHPWGLLGLDGERWEWCSDAAGRRYDILDVTDPFNAPALGDRRRVRGGPGAMARPARIAAREWVYPNQCAANIGFRVVRTVSD